jgi:hypothetical protein
MDALIPSERAFKIIFIGLLALFILSVGVFLFHRREVNILTSPAASSDPCTVNC